MDCIKLRAYATVANLSCGFDVLGLCLNNPFDEITIQKTNDRKVSINILDSPYKNIPEELLNDLIEGLNFLFFFINP